MLRLILVIFLSGICNAVYVLQDAYTPSNFFDMFNFFTGPDPTQGYVNYLDQGTARSAGLIIQNEASIKLGVDYWTTNPPGGRSSIRLESKASYDQGLIIVDLVHMPGGICSTWPAFWTLGPDWPRNGEIDIIKGVNSQTSNAMALHTSAGCSINNFGNQRFTGSIKTSNCDTQAPGQGTNVGCGIGTSDPRTYGAGFNNVTGGVYATEWTADTISVYHSARDNILADLESGLPDPSIWGEPLALFYGCDFQEAIKNQTIVFDTTFCGQWAGQAQVWEADPVCSQKAVTCQDYVANNPADFENAYWEVNYVKVFQKQGDEYIGQSPFLAPQPYSDLGVSTMSTVSTVISLKSFIPEHSQQPTSTTVLDIDVTTTLLLDDDSLATKVPDSSTGCLENTRDGCISGIRHQKPVQIPPQDCSGPAMEGCISWRPL